jgi:chemotaxis protein MotB
MAKKCKCECPECMPEWLATFGDLMSLLLCFFVLLLSMSTMDAKKIEEAIGSLQGSMGILEGGTITKTSIKKGTPTTQSPVPQNASQMAKEVSQAVKEFNELKQGMAGSAISLEEAEEGLIVHLPADISFKAGTAEIYNEDSILFLKRIALIIKTIPAEVQVQVRGFTDNTPLAKTSPFQDNWELSGARALSVVRYLIKFRVNSKKLSFAGYGEFHPITTNATPEGRKKNRRVDIVFFAQKNIPKNAKEIQKSVLDNKK